MSRLLVTEDAIRAGVIAEARKDVGYQGPVGGWSKWGAWYGPGWERAYFCAAGWSWCWNMALGETDARTVIGYQTHGGVAPLRRGFIWTVALLTQHRPRQVALRNLKPGDALMMRFVTGDNRQGNETNHVDLVEVNHPAAGYVDVIGYNVPKPGATTGDPSRGGGVWRRRVYYSSSAIVAGLQMPAAGLAERNRVAWAGVQQHLTDLRIHEFQMTGIPGPATQAAVKTYASTYGYTGSQADPLALLAHMEETMTDINRALADIRQGVTDNRNAIAKMEERVLARADRSDRSILDAIKGVAKDVWAHRLYGFPAHWWVRRGGILDPGHRHFPADPGSPADKELRAEALESGRATVYGPDGTAVLLELDQDTNRFQIKEG